MAGWCDNERLSALATLWVSSGVRSRAGRKERVERRFKKRLVEDGKNF